MIFHQYWNWAGSNIGALPVEMPAEVLLGALFTIIFRRPIAALIARVRAEKDETLHRAQQDSAKALVIAADLYRHVTGEDHRHAPGRRGDE